MSAAASNPKAEAPEEKVFLEGDHQETTMTYDHGKLPWYVAVVWFFALIGFASYMVTYALPDLGLWGSP